MQFSKIAIFHKTRNECKLLQYMPTRERESLKKGFCACLSVFVCLINSYSCVRKSKIAYYDDKKKLIETFKGETFLFFTPPRSEIYDHITCKSKIAVSSLLH